MVSPRSRLSDRKLPREPGETTAAAGIPTQNYADRLKLARHLHDQGINPLNWTRAQPAPFAEQEAFRRTRQKPRADQFEVGGRLYDWSPEVAASAAQGRAAFQNYLKDIGDPETKETSPLESYVEIDKVPLQHPLGRPARFASMAADQSVLQALIRAGIDPRRAHLGDPLPMPMQEKLNRALAPDLGGGTAAASSIDDGSQPEAGDLLYRNADGWIYARNLATREPEDVQRIRARHAEKRAADPAAPVNDNDEVAEIVQYYAPDLHRVPGTDAENDAPHSEPPRVDEQRFNERAAEKLAAIAGDLPDIVAAVEKAKAGQELSQAEQDALAGLRQKFSAIDLDLDPAQVDLVQLRSVATLIANIQATLEARSERGESIDAETRLGRAPLHVAIQGLNNELGQALVGSTIAWAQVAQGGPAEAIMSAAAASKRYGKYANVIASLANGTIASLNAAQIAKVWAEQEGNPDIFSPYTDGDTVDIQAVPLVHRPLPAQKSGLTAADIDAVEKIFNDTESTFNRTQPLSVPPAQALEMLQNGTIEGIEVFGFPMADPRGNWQTKRRAQKLKQMAIEKLKKCKAELIQDWGGEDPQIPGEQKKERHVPPGEKGIKGARKADLSFKIRWHGKIYILDINTVDVLKSGLMTAREALALKSLKANRVTRL
jgi:hypothetical protein